MVSSPNCSSLPLGLHNGINGINYSYGNGMAGCDQISGLVVIEFLLIYQVHNRLKLVHVEHLACGLFQETDHLLKFFYCFVNTILIVEFLPVIPYNLIEPL